METRRRRCSALRGRHCRCIASDLQTFFGRMKSDSTVWYPASFSFFTSVALMPRSVSFSTSSNGLYKWRWHVYGCQRRRAVKRIASRSTRASTAKSSSTAAYCSVTSATAAMACEGA